MEVFVNPHDWERFLLVSILFEPKLLAASISGEYASLSAATRIEDRVNFWALILNRPKIDST
jgi:hypothetical protein